MMMGDRKSIQGAHDDWLLYHASHQSFVCRFHGYAVTNLRSHLRAQHADLGSRARKAILAKFAGLEPQRPPKEDFRHGPSNPRPPIEGLTIRRGHVCDRCEFLTTSPKCLRVHRNKEHGLQGTKGQAVPRSSVRLQTFFTRPMSAVHYFCVTAPGSDGEGDEEAAAATPGGSREDSEVLAKIKERWAHDRDEQEGLLRVLADGAAKHEMTNWLKRSGWTAHFVERDLGEIYASSRMPGPEDTELQRLVVATDRMFFDRCIGGLQSMPLITRLLLASPHPEDAHSRPFGPLQEKTSMDRYLIYWKRFLCYCLRVLPLDEVTLRERHGFNFPAGQRSRLGQLWEHLRDEDRSDEELGEAVLQLSAGFWMQRLGGDPFESPLWHFVAVLGIDGESGQLRPAHLFTYVLAGLVYLGRALLAEYAVPTRERCGMDDLKERFAEVRNDWLCKATYSPMGYTLSLLLYGRKIARETGSRLMVSWSKPGDLMYFMGTPIPMDAIRRLVEDMITDAEAILWNELMFKEEEGKEGKEGGDIRFTIPLAAIEDDLTQTQRGRSFIHRNGLAGKEVEMLEDLVRGKRRGEFLDGDGEWKQAGIRRYLKRVRQFEELMVLAVQMSWGAPARGDEIGGLRLVNGINRDRSVFVIDGEMVLVTQYHKSLAHFDSPKVIPRFLPARPAQLLAMYMIYIRPLTDRWEADRWAAYGQMKPPSDFIWHDENGPWEGTRISRAMAKWTQHYMGTRLTVQDWRHIAIAISKKHARQRRAAKSDFDEDDPDEDEAERYEVPDDLAAAHTTATSANYGVTIDVLKRLTADSLEIFGQVSRRWHRFLGLDQPPAAAPPMPSVRSSKREREAAAAEAEAEAGGRAHSKRPRVLCLERPGADAVSDQLMLKALRAVLRDDHAQFRTPQQEEAVRLAAAKESPLVAILPTGGGKSLVFMIPAMLSGAGVTVVVAPYAELKRQLVTRCVDAGLDCKHWPQARGSWPRVVIVSAEAASGDDFMQWAADVRVQGRLDRVVIDECHLTFTAAYEYRKKLQGLVRLRSLGCPFVFLTGTLPPLSQGDFEEAMRLQRPLYIRASSHRTQARYSVVRVRNGRGPMEVKKLVEARLGSLAPGEKGVVYCASHAKCKALARLMDCHYYHGKTDDCDADSLARREAGFQSWVSGGQPYIVATAALGTGIDVPGIVHVVHLEAPHSLIDYAQEAGRAGRAGEGVEAVIVVEEKDWPAADAKADGSLELKVREVNSLIRTQGCRRRILGQCLDNDTRDCKGIEGAVLCDNCGQQELVWRSELSTQGIIAAAAYGRKVARGLERIESALDEVRELGRQGCRICWMFEGAQAGRHSWHGCDQLEESLTFNSCMEFQRGVDYRKDPHAKFLSCFYCHVSQELCRDGYQARGASCQWKHIVVPVAWAACHEEGLWAQVQQLAGRELKGQKEYLRWLGRKHSRPVCGQEMTNAMAVFKLVLDWRVQEKIS